MTKIKITHHRVMGNGCVHLWIGLLAVSQSVFYQVLNAVSDGALTSILQWRNNISFKKDRYWKACICGWRVVFIDMKMRRTHILTKGRSFKTFLKENYVIALNSLYLFTKKKCWTWPCVHYTCLKFAVDSMKRCNISR